MMVCHGIAVWVVVLLETVGSTHSTVKLSRATLVRGMRSNIPDQSWVIYIQELTETVYGHVVIFA